MLACFRAPATYLVSCSCCLYARGLVRQFARLWRLVEPISDDGCDQYLSLLSKLTAMKGGAGDLVPSADGLQCLVSPVAVRSMLPSSARRSHSIGFSEAQSAITVDELG
jgi:hypothetical protein